MSWSYVFSGKGAALATKLDSLNQTFTDEGEQQVYDAVKACLAAACRKSPEAPYELNANGSASGPTFISLKPLYGWVEDPKP